MIFAIHANAKPARLVVLAYDITSPRRARQVRRLLDSLHHAKQYSVFELRLGDGAFRGVLAELVALLDLSEDRLATWWPRDGLRLCGKQGHLTAHVPKNTGNFVICYDISDPKALHAVAGEIAPETMMVQRSVYWLRASALKLSSLFARCATQMADSDRLWAYPLQGSHDLWQIGTAEQSVLPIATHRWSEP